MRPSLNFFARIARESARVADTQIDCTQKFTPNGCSERRHPTRRVRVPFGRPNETLFVPEFDAFLQAEGVAVKKVGPLAPNLNAVAERWVQSVKQECLDHFVVVGEEYLRFLVTSYVRYYNTRRPHQSKENRPLTGLSPPEPSDFAASDIACEEQLGGLLKHYYRRAG